MLNSLQMSIIEIGGDNVQNNREIEIVIERQTQSASEKAKEKLL